MTALSKILAGEVPVVLFADTYDLHDQLLTHGYFEVINKNIRQCAKPFSMIVRHGDFMTYNRYEVGRHIPYVVDLTEVNGFYFYAHTGELLIKPKGYCLASLKATHDLLISEREYIKAARLRPEINAIEQVNND